MTDKRTSRKNTKTGRKRKQPAETGVTNLSAVLKKATPNEKTNSNDNHNDTEETRSSLNVNFKTYDSDLAKMTKQDYTMILKKQGLTSEQISKMTVDQIINTISEMRQPVDIRIAKAKKDDLKNQLIIQDYYNRAKKENKYYYPFYRGKSTHLVDPNLFLSPKTNKIVAESTLKGQIFGNKKSEVFSTIGNQIQTKIDENGRFAGFYYQNGTKDNPLPIFAIPTEYLILDEDYVGQFYAWVLRKYSNVDFKCKNSKGKTVTIDERKAMKGFRGNVIDSKGYYRAGILRKIIKQQFGSSSLAYLPTGSSEPSDVSLSDQQIKLAGFIYNNSLNVKVQTPDELITFPTYTINKDIVGLEMDNVKLEFQIGRKQKTEDGSISIIKPKVKPINSDDLLKAGMKKLKTDSITIQNLLQSLYFQGWINYPRASVIKAEDEPIYITKLVKDERVPFRTSQSSKEYIKEKFKGSAQEMILLDMIIKSLEANENGRNYIQDGYWILKANNEIIGEKRDVVFEEANKELSEDQIDVIIGDRGISIADTLQHCIDEGLTTPATRSKVIEELQYAGIIIKRENSYVLDKRGLYMVSLDEFFTGARVKQEDKKWIPYQSEKQFERVHKLKGELREAEEIVDIEKVYQKFDWLNKEERIELEMYLDYRVNDLLAIEKDIATLEEV